ncbi:MAG: hypothetical protein LBV42_04305 [Methanobrevibacter sp.]|nr:hypothetical protein [Methanobrevibacter sp.]
MTPIFIWSWLKMGNKQPTFVRKFFIGLILAGVSFLILVMI